MIDYENGAAFDEVFYENLEDGEAWEDDEAFDDLFPEIAFDDIDLSLEDN